MLGDIYWNNLPAKVNRIGKKGDEIFILFEGKINEFGRVQSGRIVLKMTTEFQVVRGVVEYHDENGDFKLDYVLEGNFEDDSYELFLHEHRFGLHVDDLHQPVNNLLVHFLHYLSLNLHYFQPKFAHYEFLHPQ